MDIVSKDQWSGWFAGMGSGGVVLQNVITGVTPLIVAGLAIWFVVLISHAWAKLGSASSPEERKDAKVKLISICVSLIGVIVAPTLILIFMNTIGNTTQTTSTTTAAPGANPDLVNHLLLLWNSATSLR